MKKQLLITVLSLCAGKKLLADTSSSASPAYKFENTSNNFFTDKDNAQEISVTPSRHIGHQQAGHHARPVDTEPMASDDSNRTQRNRWYVKEENRRKSAPLTNSSEEADDEKQTAVK